MEKRTLYKVFGIRLDILVNGKVRVDPLDPWDSSAISLGRHQLCNTGAGSCGIRKSNVNAFLGWWPSNRNPWEILGKGRDKENKFYRSHLSAVAWSVVLSKEWMGRGGPVETQNLLLIFLKTEHLHFSILSFSSPWERRLSLLCSHWEYSKCILLFGCLVLDEFFILKIQEEK